MGAYFWPVQIYDAKYSSKTTSKSYCTWDTTVFEEGKRTTKVGARKIIKILMDNPN